MRRIARPGHGRGNGLACRNLWHLNPDRILAVDLATLPSTGLLAKRTLCAPRGLLPNKRRGHAEDAQLLRWLAIRRFSSKRRGEAAIPLRALRVMTDRTPKNSQATARANLFLLSKF